MTMREPQDPATCMLDMTQRMNYIDVRKRASEGQKGYICFTVMLGRPTVQ
jgi:hypothetical protein